MLKSSNNIHQSPSPILILTISLCCCCCFTTVRSESFIKLPTDLDVAGEVCAGKFTATENIPAHCPVKCFRTDPVCGVDGVTYWCGCADALCAGTRVAKLGFCEVGSGGPAPLSGQALLLVHIVWLIVLGFSVLFGVF